MSMSKQIGAVALAVTVLMAGAAFGQIRGTVITSNAEHTGTIKWKPREKAYEVTIKEKDKDTERVVEHALATVIELKIPKPKDLTTAENHIRDGQPGAAIPLLKKIATDYLMLTWDKPATRLLADALLKSGDHEEAIKVCETVIRADEQAGYIGEVAPIYWQALQKAGKTGKVEDLMAKAIKSGDRTASASALNMRGDLILATGDTNENAKKALRDGFLRVVTLYANERTVRPEALYKAAKCFEKIGQTPRADAFRSELKRDFAGTEWASKP